MDRSPIYRSRGHRAVFTVEAEFAPGASAALDVFVEHSAEGAEPWSVAGHLPPIAATGVTAVDITGIKRFFRVSRRLVGGSIRDLARVRVREPVWR